MPRPYGYDWILGHLCLLHADIFAEPLGEDRIVDR